MAVRITFIILVAFLLGSFFVYQNLGEVRVPSLGVGAFGTVYAQDSEYQGDIIFTGDVLLGRAVETLMREVQSDYPFVSITDFLSSSDATIVNFEAVVPEMHTQTPDFEMEFSVREQYLAQLARAGVDILTFANNHAYDFGRDALEHTYQVCPLYNVSCLGHPHDIDIHSTKIIELEGTKVGVLALNATEQNIDEIALGRVLGKMSFYSDYVIVVIHWGEEYEDTHSERQERLAHALVDNGASAIIGHHPHVVQDVELYKGAPIFYSLGNFIFDQYFDESVQTGLTLHVIFSDTSVDYKLVPVSSTDTPSQPRLMTPKEQITFLDSLASKSSAAVADEIQQGLLRIPFE